MINTVSGSLLDATEDIVAHQVNCLGVMGAGIAKQMRTKWPVVHQKYKSVCDSHKPDDLLGKVQIIKINNDISVANIFGQLSYGRGNTMYTDYNALFQGLEKLKDRAVLYNKTVAIPHGIGCGLGGGKWNVVYDEIDRIFRDTGVTIYKFE